MQNPEFQFSFHNQFCKTHKDNIVQSICLKNECYNNHLLCEDCLENHQSHQIKPIQKVVTEKYKDIKSNLMKESLTLLKIFEEELLTFVKEIKSDLQKWYHPTDNTTTKTQFLKIVDDQQIYEKIKRCTIIKDQILKNYLKQLKNNIQQIVNKKKNKIFNEMSLLQYKIVPTKFEFSKQSCHDLLSINIKGTTIQKKNEATIYCLAIPNQPLTPFKPSITFTINSQSPTTQNILFGVCNNDLIKQKSYAGDLKTGIYCIYQASNKKNNAYSLHHEEPNFQYREIVGWNFRAGDSIQIILKTNSKQNEIIFKKKNTKQQFSMPLKVYNNSLLFPVVGLYGLGDKVTIENDY